MRARNREEGRGKRKGRERMGLERMNYFFTLSLSIMFYSFYIKSPK